MQTYHETNECTLPLNHNSSFSRMREVGPCSENGTVASFLLRATGRPCYGDAKNTSSVICCKRYPITVWL